MKSEPTLYRKRCEEPSFHHPHACSEMVPVEPDIGAAYTAAIDRLIHLDEYGVKAIVDAALGIGGDE